MAEKINFELVAPHARLAEMQAEQVTVEGIEGELTAMANHAPFITTLRPGFVTVRNGDATRFYVDGGFVEIHDNTVTVLADHAMQEAELKKSHIEDKIEHHRARYERAEPDEQYEAAQKLHDYLGVLARTDLPFGS